MSRWIKIPGGRTVLAVNLQGDVVGYGCRCPAVTAVQHHFIGPLYAETYEIAWDLLQELMCDVIGHNITIQTM